MVVWSVLTSIVFKLLKPRFIHYICSSCKITRKTLWIFYSNITSFISLIPSILFSTHFTERKKNQTTIQNFVWTFRSAIGIHRILMSFTSLIPICFIRFTRSGESHRWNDKRIFSGLLIRALEFVKVVRASMSDEIERDSYLFQQRANVRKRCCTDVLFSAPMPTLDHWPGIITKRSQSLIGSAWIIPAHQSNLRSIARWFDTVLGLIKQVVTGV